MVLSESPADQTIRIPKMHHRGRNCSCIRAHDGFGKVRCYAFALHHVIITLPIIAVTIITFRIHNIKILSGFDAQSGSFKTLGNNIGTAH